MIYSTLRGKLEWSWFKNGPDAAALLARRYPRFVFEDLDDLAGVVPVFTFHYVEPEAFEACCRRLAEGGYRTIDTDELLGVIEGRVRPAPRSVLLTFDDGSGSLWAVAYPLLARYGLRATAFVVPGFLVDDDVDRPNLSNVWDGSATRDAVTSRERSDAPACSWREVRAMQDAGVIDVQSHTTQHSLIHVGSRVRDFLNPSTDPYYLGNVNLPLVREGGVDQVERPLALGRPVYEALPRMAGRLRYLDDEALRRHCERYVAERGGAQFFAERDWRRQLHRQVRHFRKQSGDGGHYESPDERERALLEDLAGSRETLETRMGRPVEHLCYPWYAGSDLAVELARRAGYRSSFWGILRGRNEVRAGSDPFRIPRLDERFLPRLPGPDRRPLRQVLGDHFLPRLRGLVARPDAA